MNKNKNTQNSNLNNKTPAHVGSVLKQNNKNNNTMVTLLPRSSFSTEITHEYLGRNVVLLSLSSDLLNTCS